MIKYPQIVFDRESDLGFISLHKFYAGQFSLAVLLYRKSRSINDLIQKFEKGTGGRARFLVHQI
jgi:hypothetical protein